MLTNKDLNVKKFNQNIQRLINLEYSYRSDEKELKKLCEKEKKFCDPDILKEMEFISKKIRREIRLIIAARRENRKALQDYIRKKKSVS
jgi:hypothetical protein